MSKYDYTKLQVVKNIDVEAKVLWAIFILSVVERNLIIWGARCL